jgi:hypothetical protein
MEEREMSYGRGRVIKCQAEVHRDLNITTPSYTYPNFPRQL